MEAVKPISTEEAFKRYMFSQDENLPTDMAEIQARAAISKHPTEEEKKD